MRSLALAAALAAALFALPAAGSAQDFRATVTAQLQAAAGPTASRGFRPDATAFARDVVVGALAQGATVMLELNLTRGSQYFIVAACDEDCSDLDTRIYPVDSTTALAQDTGDDDAPMIAFTAPRTGRYMLAVDMAKCSESVCYFGYQVFKK